MLAELGHENYVSIHISFTVVVPLIALIVGLIIGALSCIASEVNSDQKSDYIPGNFGFDPYNSRLEIHVRCRKDGSWERKTTYINSKTEITVKQKTYNIFLYKNESDWLKMAIHSASYFKKEHDTDYQNVVLKHVGIGYEHMLWKDGEWV